MTLEYPAQLWESVVYFTSHATPTYTHSGKVFSMKCSFLLIHGNFLPRKIPAIQQVVHIGAAYIHAEQLHLYDKHEDNAPVLQCDA